MVSRDSLIRIVTLGAVAALAMSGAISGPALAATGDISSVATGQLWDPADVVEAPDGSLLIADRGRVRRVAANGEVTTVAGDPAADWRSPLGDGGPATRARLEPTALAALPDGGFLVGDRSNYSVRRVFPDGHIDTVAGGGHNGDGCTATRAQLYAPRGLSLTGDGGFLVTDWGNDRIARVWPDGSLTTVAGDPSPSVTGNGAPATEYPLFAPSDISATPDGGFLIADTMNARIQRVAPDGTIATVAGNGVFDFAGDGGPATAAKLYHPVGVAAVSGGGFLVADQYNHRIRRVSPGGTIGTIAGSGPNGPANGGFAGDGGPATGARLNLPSAVSPRQGGGVLIADWWNNRIRAVESPLRAAEPPPPAGFGGTGGYTGACLGLDPGFSGGSVTAREQVAEDVVLQPGGGIVTGGGGLVGGRHVFMRRFLPDGRVDPMFGDGGTVSAPSATDGRPEGLAYARAIAEQPGTGGKLLVVGDSNVAGRGQATVARFTRDGQLDRSFGVEGHAVVDNGGHGTLNSVDVAPSGKIVVGGSGSSAATAWIEKWLVARLSVDGRLDPQFDSDGVVFGTFTGAVSGVRGLADGKVLVSSELGTGRPGLALLAGRFTSSGALDQTFGEGGTAVAHPPADGEAESHALGVQADGKIVVAGWEWHYGESGGYHMMAARFSPGGKLDPSFSGDGIALVSPPGLTGGPTFASAYALAIQPDGKLVLGGRGTDGEAWFDFAFAVMRLTRDGEPDTSFGPGGGFMTPMEGWGEIHGLAVQPDGKVVAAGKADFDLGLARYGARLAPGSPRDQDATTTPLGSGAEAPANGADGNGGEPPPPPPARGARRVMTSISVLSLGRPPTLRQLARRGWSVRVRVSRPGVVTLRVVSASGGKARRVVLAKGSRRAVPGVMRVVLRSPRPIRAQLARRAPRRLNAMLRAQLVENGGSRIEATRRVALRGR